MWKWPISGHSIREKCSRWAYSWFRKWEREGFVFRGGGGYFKRSLRKGLTFLVGIGGYRGKTNGNLFFRWYLPLRSRDVPKLEILGMCNSDSIRRSRKLWIGRGWELHFSFYARTECFTKKPDFLRFTVLATPKFLRFLVCHYEMKAYINIKKNPLRKWFLIKKIIPPEHVHRNDLKATFE